MSALLAPERVERLRATLEPVTELGWLEALERKYGEPGLVAESLKAALLGPYSLAQRRAVMRGEDSETISARAREFWAEWEAINRLLIPDDPVYSGTRPGFALTVTDDYWTLTTAATAQARLLESFVAGEAAASAIVRLAVQISTGGATPTNQTPERFNSRSPAATSLFRTAWTTDPTLSGSAALMQAFNAFGGMHTWVPATPDAAIYLVNGEQLSARSASGTSTVSGHAIWEEL